MPLVSVFFHIWFVSFGARETVGSGDGDGDGDAGRKLGMVFRI